MKKFNAFKVSQIAIDKTEHQQLYVHDPKRREEVFETLYELGFTTRLEEYTERTARLPIVVNTKYGNFHTSASGAYVAFALEGGAKLLTLDELLELIDEPPVS